MLIKCQKCGHENQLGAIFCRGCGEKLDIEKIRPVVGNSKKYNILKVIKRLVTLLIFVAFAGMVAALFIPSGFKKITVLEEDAQAGAKDKFDRFVLRLDGPGKQRSEVFSVPEASYILNNLIIEPQEDKSREILFDTTSSGRLNFVTTSKIFDKVPMRIEISGRIIPEDLDEKEDNTDKMAFSYKVLDVKFGHLPVPAFIYEKVLEKLKPLCEAEKVSKVLKALEKVEIDPETGFMVEIKKPYKKAQKN